MIMTKALNVLIIEDSQDDALLMLLEFKKAGYEVKLERVESYDTMRMALERNNWDLIVSDYHLPGFSGIEALNLYNTYKLDIPFILVSGMIGEDKAVLAMKSGAGDYIMKDNLKRFIPAVERELKEFKIREEKRKAEKSLKESEEKFRSIYEISVDAIGLALKGEIIAGNPAFLTLFGYESEEEILGKKVIEYYAPSERPKIVNYMKERAAGKEVPTEYETIGQRKDGSEFFMSQSITRFQLGDQMCSVAIMRDITERKLTAGQLQQHNENLKILLNISQNTFESTDKLLAYSLKQAIKLTESNGGYIFLYDSNKNQYVIKTYSGRLIDHCINHNMQPAIVLDSVTCCNDVIQTQKPFIHNRFSKIKHCAICKNYCEVDKLLSLPVIVNSKMVGGICLFDKNADYNKMDVTQLTLLIETVWKVIEKQQYQDELIRAKEKAEESDRLKSAFLASMSHEIRTPLNSIIGFSDILAEKANDPESITYANLINKQNNLLLQLINDIIDFAKVEAGVLEIINSTFDLNKMINELYLIFKSKCKNGITLIPKTLDAELFIFSDLQRIKQIFTNLISNAIKFTEKGSITFGYEIDEKSEIRCFVCDTGIGIPYDQQEKIFERFTKLNSFTQGTGLGLSIVKNIVELMEGTHWLCSELNKGSSFFFKIPFKIKENDNFEKEKDENIKALNTGGIILIAEDDDSSFLYLKKMMPLRDINILRVNNGIEAVKACLKNKNICLVLMDIKMPLLDGYEATKQIKFIRPQLPVIAQTAQALKGDEYIARAAGCDGYIAKPYSKKKLFKLIGSLQTTIFDGVL